MFTEKENQATSLSFDVALLLLNYFVIFFSLLFVFSAILLNARTHYSNVVIAMNILGSNFYVTVTGDGNGSSETCILILLAFQHFKIPLIYYYYGNSEAQLNLFAFSKM